MIYNAYAEFISKIGTANEDTRSFVYNFFKKLKDKIEILPGSMVVRYENGKNIVTVSCQDGSTINMEIIEFTEDNSTQIEVTYLSENKIVEILSYPGSDDSTELRAVALNDDGYYEMYLDTENEEKMVFDYYDNASVDFLIKQGIFDISFANDFTKVGIVPDKTVSNVAKESKKIDIAIDLFSDIAYYMKNGKEK